MIKILNYYLISFLIPAISELGNICAEKNNPTIASVSPNADTIRFDEKNNVELYYFAFWYYSTPLEIQNFFLNITQKSIETNLMTRKIFYSL
jgi:hypothetical protein